MSSTRKKKILVVDDDHAIVRAIVINLLTVGYEPVTARDGAEGLRKVVEENPDLVILDIMMPEIDGFEVLKLLKGNPETRHIPVVMLTAYPSDQNMMLSYGLESDCFIPKPFEPEDLLTVVERLLIAAEEEQLRHE
jgi:DNA-binding response OmpR family regulator